MVMDKIRHMPLKEFLELVDKDVKLDIFALVLKMEEMTGMKCDDMELVVNYSDGHIFVISLALNPHLRESENTGNARIGSLDNLYAGQGFKKCVYGDNAPYDICAYICKPGKECRIAEMIGDGLRDINVKTYIDWSEQ
jgi:hypothetical protein